MKTVFFGASSYTLSQIDLLRKDYDLTLVITTELNDTDAVPAYCLKHSIPFVCVHKISKEIIQQISETKADIGVLSYFGLLLPDTLLALFPLGILNIHPSLLPKYRGATPVQTAILNGDTVTGVTIMLLDSHMDHGPIFKQVQEQILLTDTTASLHERLFAKGADLLRFVLPEYINGSLLPTTQDETKATYSAKNLTRKDGYFAMQNPPAPQKLDRMVRAYFPWPGVWMLVTLKDKPVRIKLLPGHMLQVEGKKPVNVKDFLNGYPEAEKMVRTLYGNL